MPKWLVLLALLAGAARADEPPAVDIRDLPPLPAVVHETDSAQLEVVAAIRAEEETVVGAAKREQSLGDVASAVTVLSGDRLRRFGYRTVSEALRAVAGLYVVDDRMSERLGIRGLQILGDFNTRILVLIDGATVNEPWNQFVGISTDLPVHLDDVARIEIVRGPVSSLYGTNAFFCTINIVTRGADQSPAAYARVGGGLFPTLSGNAGFATGTVNRQLRGTVAFALRDGETVDFPEFVAAGAPSGETRADGLSAFNASLVGHYDGGFLQVRAYRKLRQLAGAPYDTVIGDADSHNVDEQLLVEGGYARDVGRWTLTARGYFDRYQFQDLLIYDPPPNYRDIGDSTWFGGEARAHLRAGPGSLTVGAEITRNITESHSFFEDDPGGNPPIPSDNWTEGLYGEVEVAPLSWLSLTGGLRLDTNSIFETNLSPRLGVLLREGERYGAKLLYAEGFRNPSPFEAFFHDQTDIIKPERPLGSEIIKSYELVLWGRPFAGLSMRLSGFIWDLSDIIEAVHVVTPMGERLRNQNTGAAMRSAGAEAEASYRDTTGWYAFASATLASVTGGDQVDAETGAPMEPQNAPLLVAAAGASTPRLGGILHVSTEIVVTSSRLTRTARVEAGPHASWDLAFYVPDFHHADITLGVRNIIDTREEIPAQGDYDRKETGVPIYLIPGEGREIYARVGYRF